MIFSDPIISPFNEWLKNNALTLALVIAGLLLVIVVILFLLNMSSKKENYEENSKGSSLFVFYVGGKENIDSVSKVGSRINLVLKDYSLINEIKLKENGVISIIKMSNKITLVVNKGDSDHIFNSLN